MFGYVMANTGELEKHQKTRYGAVYCGICRQIRGRSGNLSRLMLSYDMAFLALLLMSLYEPEENGGDNACLLHPIQKRPWVDNAYIRYAADMNVALSYYKCLDDWNDDQHLGAKAMASILEKHLPDIRAQYPRQCQAIEDCISQLSRLEKENCPNPDLPANCFGRLMAALLVYKEDLWAEKLQQMGMALGRFIYLADAVVDHPKDKKKGKYNPLWAQPDDPEKWENYLVLAMGRCTAYYEQLPLVQDKAILDNILYSGVWIELRRRQKRKQEDTND